MASYTIANGLLNEQIDDNTLRSYYECSKKQYGLTQPNDLDSIFIIALRNSDRFPSIAGVNTPRDYIDRWVKKYCDAIKNPPSARIASPKSACSDPAIAVIVRATHRLTEQQSTAGETYHNLFMSAENIQGNLLEEYIALKIRPYGFLWCIGNVLRAIDFCKDDGSLFLQVKNKSNTENSSSSDIRKGTGIVKWYRLGTRIEYGAKCPVFKWDDLNMLCALPPHYMSEQEYERFLVDIASRNPGLITYLDISKNSSKFPAPMV